jgi:phosphate-selective porin OprO and OprP
MSMRLSCAASHPTDTRKSLGSKVLPLLVLAVLLTVTPQPSRGQNSIVSTPDSKLQDTLATEWEMREAPKRKLVKWNEFDGPFSTLRFGIALLYEVVAYAQDEKSEQQFDLQPAAKVRDFRLLLSGRFKSERPITWKAGIFYDGPTDSWLVRETGLMIAVPELWGHFFVGRTKEGFSLNKVMVGYHGWTLERATVTDAIPILADGVKWLGYVPNMDMIWNIGVYTDWLSQGESFSTYDWQISVRFGWLPVFSEANGTLLHLGVNGRYGQADAGKLQIRSRPEAFLSPYFVDTGKFPAHHSRHIGFEAYYRTGPWLIGTEYYLQKVSSPEMENPLFQGGELMATFNITGETRDYSTVGGILKTVSPARTVFEGGPGAWEVVLRFSYIDLDGGTLHGGTFWRLTPMVNWYLSDNLRLEVSYGYGVLERFGIDGGTHFFQSRIQLQL